MASGQTTGDKEKDSRWYFTVDQLQKTPSRKCGIDSDQELQHRQNAAYLIQGMGERLRVSQLCINTAIVYMHRFYAFHSFTHFHRNGIAAASLFLAAKVEEQPRKLDTVIHTAHVCLNMEMPDPSKESYQEQAQDLVFNENVLLQTLGFDVAVDHPHTHVVKTCHLVKACKDLAQTSYFLASNSLHLTTMCLQYRPTVVACFCIYLACKWSRWEIPQSTEGKYWFHYVDKGVTMELLEQLTNEFLVIYEKSPARLKSKLNSIKPIGLSKGSEGQKPSIGQPSSSSAAESRSLHGSSTADHNRSHSSHHRSNHHHKQPSQSSGEIPAAKHLAQQIPQKLPHPSSSASISSASRHRPERGEPRPLIPEPQFPSLHRTSGSSSKSSGGHIQMGGKLSGVEAIVPQSGQQQQRGHSSSSSMLDSNYQMSMNKNRNQQQHSSSGLPSLVSQESHRHLAKMEQHQRQQHLMKEAKMIDTTSKNLMKSSQSSSIGNLYHSSNDNQRSSSAISRSTSSSSSSSSYLQQQQQQPPPPNYNQAIANRNLLAVDHSSVHIQQQQQQQQKSQMPPIESSCSTITNTTSFRLTDELSRLTEPMAISSPPKHSSSLTKAPSIFSPEWNEKPNSVQSSTTTATILNSSMKQQSAAAMLISSSGNNIVSQKSVKSENSPKIKQHEKRPETPKKDKRMELPITPVPQKTLNPMEKRSNSAKKISDTPGMPVINIPPPVSPFDTTTSTSAVHKSQQQHQHISNVPIKRTHPDDLIKQEDGIDFRETKLRKLDIQQLSPNAVRNNNKAAIYAQHQQQQQINVPIENTIKSQQAYANAMNGIETNPDLVSSLLKESLCNDIKYTPYNPPTTNPISMPSSTQQMQVQQQHHHHQQQQLQLQQQQQQQQQMHQIQQVNAQTTIPSQQNIQPPLLLPPPPPPLISATSSLIHQQQPQVKPVASSMQQIGHSLINPIKLESIKMEKPDPINLNTNNTTISINNNQQKLPIELITPVLDHPPIKIESTETATGADGVMGDVRIKSEKKKKKDKHKHKEKEKSKDKEERKKHKKDKDRQKEKDVEKRDKYSHDMHNPIKITIPKDKLNLPSIETSNLSLSQQQQHLSAHPPITGFKITIPKDRIKTDVPPPPPPPPPTAPPNSSSTLPSQSSTAQSIPMAQQSLTSTPSLKIKISKDMIESYNPNAHHHHHHHHISGSGSMANTGNSSNSGSSSHGSKKKDRDKDRERDRTKNSARSLDYNKHNGSGSSSNMPPGGGGNSNNNTNNGGSSGGSTRGSHPNKEIWVNM